MAFLMLAKLFPALTLPEPTPTPTPTPIPRPERLFNPKTDGYTFANNTADFGYTDYKMNPATYKRMFGDILGTLR